MSEQHQNLIRTIESQRARIEALEKALREAVPCLEDSGYLPQAKAARAALNPEK